VIVVNGLFSFWQEHRAEQAIQEFEALLPARARVVRDGQVELVAAESLVPGDVILLEAGDRVPADARVIEQRVSRAIAVFATALGALFFLAATWMHLPLWQGLLFGIGILVANVPEGLLPTVTLALAMGSRRMAARNALVRNRSAVETLGSCSVICTDKTGTLTQNRMEVRELFVAGERFDASCAEAVRALAERHARVLQIAARCHSLREGELERSLGDPMELALVRMARLGLGSTDAAKRADELPFDSDRRRASVVSETPQGLVLDCKGAPEVLLELSAQKMTAEGAIVPMDAGARASIELDAVPRGHDGGARRGGGDTGVQPGRVPQRGSLSIFAAHSLEQAALRGRARRARAGGAARVHAHRQRALCDGADPGERVALR